MGSEQDHGWTIKTERDYTYLRGSARSFYESRATHPIYGETIPARSIDEDTAYQETLARIERVESQLGPASAMPLVDTAEMANLTAEAELAAEATDPTPNVEPNTATLPIVPSLALDGSEQEHEQVGGPDPLAAEFGQNTRLLNLTRRVENGLANHRRVPRHRPKGHIILK
jgi:hypothetical protein